MTRAPNSFGPILVVDAQEKIEGNNCGVGARDHNAFFHPLLPSDPLVFVRAGHDFIPHRLKEPCRATRSPSVDAGIGRVRQDSVDGLPAPGFCVLRRVALRLQLQLQLVRGDVGAIGALESVPHSFDFPGVLGKNAPPVVPFRDFVAFPKPPDQPAALVEFPHVQRVDRAARCNAALFGVGDKSPEDLQRQVDEVFVVGLLADDQQQDVREISEVKPALHRMHKVNAGVAQFVVECHPCHRVFAADSVGAPCQDHGKLAGLGGLQEVRQPRALIGTAVPADRLVLEPFHHSVPFARRKLFDFVLLLGRGFCLALEGHADVGPRGDRGAGRVGLSDHGFRPLVRVWLRRTVAAWRPGPRRRSTWG